MTLAGFRPRNRCPLCQSETLADRMVLDGIRVAGCAACGFMFSRDMLAPAAIDALYIDGYAGRRQMDGQRVNAGVNVELLRSFCPDLSEKSLLDIGSGYGFFLDKLRNSGTRRVAGVEISQVERKYAVEELRLDTLAKLDDLSGNDQFDIITLFEVIEHIPAPYEFVAKAGDHLKPGGSLVVGTDNFTCDVVKVLGEGFPKWIPHEHLSFFSPQTLQEMLLRSGQLRLAGTQSFTPWELLLRKLVYRASGGRKGGKSYSYAAETGSSDSRAYRFFPLRLAINRSWFKLTRQSSLNGEMMYFHLVKPA
jgi:2-polyprenyl-3-methyl-5-hydroxy-6-metoxy-1,4-benzoquinol methylase